MASTRTSSANKLPPTRELGPLRVERDEWRSNPSPGESVTRHSIEAWVVGADGRVLLERGLQHVALSKTAAMRVSIERPSADIAESLHSGL